MSAPARVSRPPTPGDRDLRRSWWSLAFYPLGFVLAFVVGEGLYSMLVEDGAEAAVWEVLVAATPALVLFVTPGVAAFLFGRRARQGGREDALAPMVIGAVVGLGFVAVNLVSFLLQVVIG
jgi:hypothetical protein